MWPITEKENRQLLIFWLNIISYSKLLKLSRYGSLINIKPSGFAEATATSYNNSVAALSTECTEKRLSKKHEVLLTFIT